MSQYISDTNAQTNTLSSSPGARHQHLETRDTDQTDAFQSDAVSSISEAKHPIPEAFESSIGGRYGKTVDTDNEIEDVHIASTGIPEHLAETLTSSSFDTPEGLAGGSSLESTLYLDESQDLMQITNQPETNEPIIVTDDEASLASTAQDATALSAATIGRPTDQTANDMLIQQTTYSKGNSAPGPSMKQGIQRARQASQPLFARPKNPVEAYLASNLLYEPTSDTDDRDIAEIDGGKWVSKIPPFKISIPDYSTCQLSGGRGGYTIFHIVSSVVLAPLSRTSSHEVQVDDLSRSALGDNDQDSSNRQSEIREISVKRRYTHFQHLHTMLKASLPLIAIPDLPEKRFTGNFDAAFLQSRRRDLERYLARLARHVLIRSNRAFLDFLGCECDEQYDAGLHRSLMKVLRKDPEHFFTRVKHDADYFDETQLLEDSRGESARFARHIRAVEKGGAVPAIAESISSYRDSLQGKTRQRDSLCCLCILTRNIQQQA